MSKSTPSALPLDYANAKRDHPPQFRVGVISLSLAILATVLPLATNIARMPASIINLLVHAAMVVGAVGIATGIGGLFQRRGRNLAIVGLILSVLDFIFLPALMVA